MGGLDTLQNAESPSFQRRSCLRLKPGNFSGETKRPYIRALQCAMRGCLKKATDMGPKAIFFLLHCGAKLQDYGLFLACSLFCVVRVQ